MLRFISRRVCKAAILADDYLIVAALLFAAGEVTGGLLCKLSITFFSKTYWIITDPQFPPNRRPQWWGKACNSAQESREIWKGMLNMNDLYYRAISTKHRYQLVLITEMFQPSAIASVKISILLLYLRIFPGPRFRMIVWSVGSFVACCCLVQTLCVMFQCRPVQAAWNPKVKGDCIQLSKTYIILTSFNALTDIIALCLPMPFLWRLHTDNTRKAQLIGTFGLGTL